jgi:threonine dehydrogenase-like Zn-dependent dehydrogenase
MKSWKVTAERQVTIEETAAQPVGKNCVKLKMLAASINFPERNLFVKGGARLPLILGTNGVGMVIETGESVTKFQRGDFAYIRPMSVCGDCSHCKSGKVGDCEKNYVYGKTEDGVMRDFIVVPSSDLVLLPEKITPTEGTFIESVALAVSAIDRLKLEKGEHIVIMGATNVGLILAQAALYYQAIPILVDMREDRLKIAEKMGVYYTVNAVDTDPIKKIFTITCGKKAETMAYCLLSGMPVQRSFECLSSHGRAAFVGFDTMDDTLNFNFMPLIDRNIEVYAVSNAIDNYLTAVNMIASFAVDVKPLVGKRITFDEVGKALEEVADDVNKFTNIIVDIDEM